MEKPSGNASVRTVKKTMNPHSLKNLRSWKKGESGNPGGRPKRKPMVEALHEAITEHPELLKKIVLNALRRASRDHRFFVEVRDMLDGKPAHQHPAPEDEDIPQTIEEIDAALLKLLEIAEERKERAQQPAVPLEPLD
jgi:hypothetical protein